MTNKQNCHSRRTQPGKAMYNVYTWKHDEARIARADLGIFTIDELPFKFVENEAFIKLMNAYNGRVIFPSRHTTSRNVAQLYLDERIKYIRGLTQRIKKFKEAVEDVTVDTKKFLCGETPTWWNSTFELLKSAYNVRDALVEFGMQENHLRRSRTSLGV
ncbi:hypothetical protein LXL04_023199 [Taraxacum kok-saghyz]